MVGSCRKPVDPILEEDSFDYHSWGTFDVGGECLDVDVSDSILVTAANYNGFFVLKIDENNQTLEPIYHDRDLDPTVGDNRAERVILSKNHGIVFILDKYDKIWMHKLNGAQYMDNWVSSCTFDVWLGMAIDDREDEIGIYSLVKHNAAQTDTGGTVGDFDQFSTSLIWKNLTDVAPEDLFNNSGHPQCEYTYNFSILPSELFYSDGLLSVANGELGVLVLKQTHENICLDDSETIIQDFIPTGDITVDRDVCEKPQFLGGFNGIFEPKNGMIPSIFSSFDTPGKVRTVYSVDHTILAGLSNSNGCFIQNIDTTGTVLNHHIIADGFSVYGIHFDGELLALACGHDGVLVYEWNGVGIPVKLGQIETSYANKLNINQDRIFVATEDGIEIIEINRSP